MHAFKYSSDDKSKMTKTTGALILLPFLFIYVHAYDFYAHTATDIRSNEPVSFKKYKGKVVLVVNVASECGYTQSNYEDLVTLQKKFPKETFAVLAFPCNDFGGQEPRANRHIWKYADDRFQMNFDMFNKVKCVGEHAYSLFRWLKREASNQVLHSITFHYSRKGVSKIYRNISGIFLSETVFAPHFRIEFTQSLPIQ